MYRAPPNSRQPEPTPTPIRNVRRSSSEWSVVFPEIHEIDDTVSVAVTDTLIPLQFLTAGEQEWSAPVSITLQINMTHWSEEAHHKRDSVFKLIQLLQSREERWFEFTIVAVARCQEVKNLPGEQARHDQIRQFSVESFRIPVQGTVTDLKCNACWIEVTFGCSFVKKVQQ